MSGDARAVFALPSVLGGACWYCATTTPQLSHLAPRPGGWDCSVFLLCGGCLTLVQWLVEDVDRAGWWPAPDEDER